MRTKSRCNKTSIIMINTYHQFLMLSFRMTYYTTLFNVQESPYFRWTKISCDWFLLLKSEQSSSDVSIFQMVLILSQFRRNYSKTLPPISLDVMKVYDSLLIYTLIKGYPGPLNTLILSKSGTNSIDDTNSPQDLSSVTLPQCSRS